MMVSCIFTRNFTNPTFYFVTLKKIKQDHEVTKNIKLNNGYQPDQWKQLQVHHELSSG